MNKAVFFLLGAFLIAQVGCATNARSTLKYDVVVTQEGCLPTVSCYATLQGALNASKRRKHQNIWHRILIKAGTYNEKVVVDQPFIHLIGEGVNKTHISIGLPAQHARQYHRDNWGTAGSATLTITAADIRIENMHVENTFDYIANDSKERNDPSRVQHSQAVAVLLDVDSDRVEFKNVRLDSYQDTLFAHGKRAYFRDGIITGNVDFIFGDGQVFFENSDIISRLRGRNFLPGEVQGHITAPSTQIDSAYGLVFNQCRLLREEGVPDASHTLGRPWHPTTTFEDGRYADPDAVGYAAFVDTYIGAHIMTEGWGSMNGTARDGTKTRVFTPEESRFYERGSRGPGRPQGESAKMRKVLDSSVSIDKIKSEMLGNWVKML